MSVRVVRIPVGVLLNVASGCNLHCRHCSAEVFRELRDPELSHAEWKRVLNRLASVGVCAVVFTGGEPFSRPWTMDLIENAAELGFARIDVETNATLMTPEIADRLVAARVNRVLTSLDGLRDTHDRIRGWAGAFDAAIEGISLLRATGLFTVVQLTAMRQNLTEIERVAEVVLETGVTVFGIRNLASQGGAAREYGQLALDTRQRRELRLRVQALRAKLPGLKIIHNTALFDSIAEDEQGGVSGSGGHLMMCSAAQSTCSITPDGWLIPCQLLGDFRAGNVRDQDILDIWNKSPVLAEIREIAALTMKEVEECTCCVHTSVCGGGCRGHAYNVHRRLVSPDPDCPLWDRSPRHSEGYPITTIRETKECGLELLPGT